MTDKLPTWDGSGHVTELALVALADGQTDLVDADARAHVESCEECAAQLADFALQSIAVGEALERVPRKLPVSAVVFALGLALLGFIPSLLEPAWMGRLANAPHTFALFMTATVTNVRAFAHAPVATFGAATLLVLCGILVARQKRDLEVRS
jgi:hypothetical protein